MNRKSKADFLFSEVFEDINAEQFTGWIVHLLCHAGSGTFVYNSKEVRLHANDAAVISHPELVSNITADNQLQVEFLAVKSEYIYNLLPANHYGVGGGISLFDNPIIPLSAEDATRFADDLHRISERMHDRHHLFYDELIGSLLLTMIYDLFEFHAKLHDGVSATERTANIVRRLLSMLEAGRCKQHREVAYFAEQLNVTPKYLSQTVKRNTGRSVSYLIDRHTIPIIADYLKNSDLSLTQISIEMNFSSLSYFSRYVQKHFGVPPGEYRATHSPVRKKHGI